MDYHFYRDEPTPKSTTTHLPSFVKSFLPVFALAIFLPLFLFFALTPNQLKFTSQANQAQGIRIWFEPSSIATTPGVPVKVDVMAQTDNGEKTIYNLTFPISVPSNMSVTPSRINYATPFAGRVVLQTIEITSPRTGEFTLQIPKEEVVASEANLTVETASLKLLVTP